jgi:hypothetical protein
LNPCRLTIKNMKTVAVLATVFLFYADGMVQSAKWFYGFVKLMVMKQCCLLKENCRSHRFAHRVNLRLKESIALRLFSMSALIGSFFLLILSKFEKTCNAF